MTRDGNGYTLVELVVVILIFSIVMLIMSTSFSRITSSSAQIIKAAETDIGGLIGLELLRCDLDLAGFGLPWTLTGVKYREAENRVLVKGCPDGCPRADASLFNDASTYADAPGAAPRAFVVGDNVGLNGSDYLVLKGTALGMSRSSRRWSYLSYSSSGTILKASKSEAELKPGNGDRVIVLKTGIREGEPNRELVTDGVGGSYSFVFDTTLPEPFRPTSKLDNYLVYGVTQVDQSGAPDSLSFPFNRADYFISRTSAVSSTCAPGTGILYKVVFNHGSTPPSSTPPTYYPILDCAADLQAVLFLDTNGDGEVDYHTCDPGPAYDAGVLRQQLKEIRIYILAQQGAKDRSYLFPVADPGNVIVVGDAGLDQSLGAVLGSKWSESELARAFGSEWRHYHWKLYTIVVQPQNL